MRVIKQIKIKQGNEIISIHDLARNTQYSCGSKFILQIKASVGEKSQYCGTQH